MYFSVVYCETQSLKNKITSYCQYCTVLLLYVYLTLTSIVYCI